MDKERQAVRIHELRQPNLTAAGARLPGGQQAQRRGSRPVPVLRVQRMGHRHIQLGLRQESRAELVQGNRWHPENGPSPGRVTVQTRMPPSGWLAKTQRVLDVTRRPGSAQNHQQLAHDSRPGG